MAPLPLNAWLLDERAHAGSEHLDPAYVAAYDTKSPTDWGEDVELLRELGLGDESTIVDLGAGTGTFALAVAPHVGRVVAVDVSPAMVAALRARGVEAVRAGFLTYDHDGAAPDAVHTRNALHHLPDFWKAIALERIARLLRPGGALLLADLVYSFEAAETDDAIAAWLASARPPIRRGAGRPASSPSTCARSTRRSPPLLKPMLERAGFEIRDRWTSESGVYAAYTCLTIH